MLSIIQFLKKPRFILIIILLSAIFFRLYRLDYPNSYVFDEVYHAFTAKEYLKGSKDAWDPFATSPKGVAYEWTHPPLAKEVMTVSMFLVRSQNPWAWRLPGVLLGVVSVWLVYMLGLKLLNNQIASLIASFAFSIDGLNFVQSRTGMNDIYFVTFMLATLLLFLNKKIFWSAIFLGLAISSKWAAVYIYLILIPFLLFQRKHSQILYFLIIPLIVYSLTYIPFFLLGHNLNQFITLQQQMWWYHMGLKATHDYSSPWWSWPLNLYPVWYFVDYIGNSIANIFASGNLAVFLIGSISLILTFWETFKGKSVSLFIIVLGFFVFWLPWAVSPRIMFLYHFSPSVPFLALALGHKLSLFFESNTNRRFAIILILFMFVTFILTYPFLVGIPLPKNLVDLFFLTNLSKNPF